MRTSLGITFLNAEIMILLSVSTTKTVSPIPIEEKADEMSPRVGAGAEYQHKGRVLIDKSV